MCYSSVQRWTESSRTTQGQETTAGSFCWGLKYLTDHPHVQKKLRAELLHAFDIPEGCAPILSYEQIQSGRAPYLDAVVAEILRLGGAAPLLCRQGNLNHIKPLPADIEIAKRDTHILGHFIPKGTEVMLLSHHTGLYDTVTNQHVYSALDLLRPADAKERSIPPWKDDGLLFIPERWIDANGKFNSQAGPSYPFGAGLRSCFGSKLAVGYILQMVRQLLIDLHRCFNLSLVLRALIFRSSSNAFRIQNWKATKSKRLLLGRLSKLG